MISLVYIACSTITDVVKLPTSHHGTMHSCTKLLKLDNITENPDLAKKVH